MTIQANWLDKAIGWVSPGAGVRRLMARRALLAYEGVKTGRRFDGWNTTGSSANAEVGSALARLRNNSRDFYRNNPHARKAIRELRNKVIGAGGIIPQSRAANKANRRLIDEVFKRHREECDWDGRHDWAGLQLLAVKTIFESGEVLSRRRVRQTGDLGLGLQYQLLEPDHLDLDKSQALADGFVLQGVEHSRTGRRRAYWLFGTHPGEVMNIGSQSRSGWESRPVSAAEIAHAFEQERIGQVRGVPFCSAVMSSMRDMDEYNEAVRVRKKIEACFAAFVYNANPEDGGIAIQGTDAATGQRKETFEPGMIEYLNGAKDVKFADPKSSGGEEAMIRTWLRSEAAGWGLPYSIYGEDWSQSNYSSSRMGMVNLQEEIEIFRWFAVIQPLIKPWWRWMIDAAYLDGQILEPDYAWELGTPEFNLLDRGTEAKADDLQLANGSLTWGQMCARYGWDPEQQFSEFIAWRQRLKDAGVELGGRRQTPDARRQ